MPATTTQSVPYAIIDRFTVAENWDGAPLILQVNQNANMPETPNGSMVFEYENLATQNNQGEVAVTSGGGAPAFKYAYACVNQPSIWTNNWRANNLSVTNISLNANTPVQIQAVGPGMPGTNPLPLPIGTPLPLAPGQTAQTNALPQWMQVVFQCTRQLAIFVLIGGPPDSSGNNGYVVAVNASSDTGPGTGNTPPPGYFATTTTNSLAYTFNWGSSLVFVANTSGQTSTGAQVILRQL
ncbi:MAG: hypothetical protein ACRERE_10800 [Candidatus Entotheonellia bacterium]